MTYRSLLIVSGLFHAFVGLRLVSGLGGHLLGQLLLVGWLLLSTLLMPLGVLGNRLLGQPWGDRVAWLGLLLMGYFSSVLVLTVLRDAVLLVLGLFDAGWSGELPWGVMYANSVEWLLLAAFLVTALGFWNARRTPVIKLVEVPIRGLPRALVGFTVAQITDIHVGPTIKHDYLQRIVERVNSIHADVVAVTGDLVDGTVPELAAHVAPLAGLKSRHGTFFVTGNHEYYSGAQAWINELRRLGLTVLMNEHVVIYHGRAIQNSNGFAGDAQDDSQMMAPLVLAGVTDYSAHNFDPSHLSDPDLALEGAPETVPLRILLAHQPRSAPAAAKAGFDLQLSGHTHGGQFYPWNFFVRFQQPYIAGLDRLGFMWVYTSRGTGYWGPPKRFGSPSEITQIRLVAG
ncbi:MAG: metallophosphoesterase [Pseudomonadota bacterium]